MYTDLRNYLEIAGIVRKIQRELANSHISLLQYEDLEERIVSQSLFALKIAHKLQSILGDLGRDLKNPGIHNNNGF